MAKHPTKFRMGATGDDQVAVLVPVGYEDELCPEAELLWTGGQRQVGGHRLSSALHPTPNETFAFQIVKLPL